MRLICFLIFVVFTHGSHAQTSFKNSGLASEYSLISKDSLKVKREFTGPQKAAILSAVIPGAGQIYNHKYWKAGIVYLGSAGLIYMFVNNTDSMRRYNTAYSYRIDNDTNTKDLFYPLLTDASVKNYRDFHRRLRDISILGFVGLYAIQIIDANVDAHLKEFRVNEDLSMTIKPNFDQLSWNNAAWPGLKITFKF